MTNLAIERYVPSGHDYQRVDDLLTEFSKSKGGVDYKHVVRDIYDDEENPKLRVSADFLSWGCVTLRDIEIIAPELQKTVRPSGSYFENSALIRKIENFINPEAHKLKTKQLYNAAERLFHNVKQEAEEANMASVSIESIKPEYQDFYLTEGFLRSADIPHVWHFRKTFFLQSLEVNGDVILPPANGNGESVISRQAKEFGQGFKALDQSGQLLGELIALYNPLGELEVERIFIDPKGRGKGIGRKLMDDCETFAKEMEMRSIIVASPTWQQGFVDSKGGFYERCGYKRLIAIPLNLTREFGNSTQYNVYYKKDLGTKDLPKYHPEHMFFTPSIN